MIPVLQDVIEEHFDELDFLWEQREGVLFAPDWNATELAELEERAEAHLDGLRLAGPVAVEIASPHLDAGEASGACAATLVLMESGQPEHAQAVLDAFEAADGAALQGIRSGLRHCSLPSLEADLRRVASEHEAPRRAAAIDVLAFQRASPPDGFESLLDHEDPWVLQVAYASAGRWANTLQATHLASGLRSEIPEVRRAALEAAARSGLAELRDHCLAAVDSADPVPEALAFLGVLGNPEDLQRLSTSLSDPALAIAAIEGLGALGRTSVVPSILEAMTDESLSEAAAAAYTRITGLEVDVLAGEDGDPQEAAEPTAEEEDPPDRPDADQARDQWNTHASEFHPQKFWQQGCEAGDPLAALAAPGISLEARRDLYLRARAAGANVDYELEGRTPRS